MAIETLLLAAAAKSSGGAGVDSVAFIVVLILVALTAMYRLRRGGKGPVTNWFPRSMRSRVNEVYRKEGWPEPYDRRGNRAAPRDD
jgi:hypothetical protein